MCYFFGSYLSVKHGCVEYKYLTVKFKDMEMYKLHGEDKSVCVCAKLIKLVPVDVTIYSYEPVSILDSDICITDHVVFSE